MSLTSIFAWRQVKKVSISTSISKNSFMCFAGIAKPESHTLQQIEKDIKINRKLDLQRLVPCFIRVLLDARWQFREYLQYWCLRC